MKHITKDKIFSKLEYFREYLNYLTEIKKEVKTRKEFVSDFHLHGSAERYLQLTIQIIIDVVNLIIVDNGDKRPEDNYEAVAMLRKKGVITKKTADNVTAMIGLRNLLVHEYGEIDRKRIYEILRENIGDLEKFYKEIIGYMRKD
jgi:uncharacterized protein YutE (UPF0331/DUF86 family)